MAKLLNHSIFLLLVGLFFVAKAHHHDEDDSKFKFGLRIKHDGDSGSGGVGGGAGIGFGSSGGAGAGAGGGYGAGTGGGSGTGYGSGSGVVVGVGGGSDGQSGGGSGGSGGAGGAGGCKCEDSKLKEFLDKFLTVLKAYLSKEFVPELQSMASKMGLFVMDYMAKEKPDEMGKVNKFLEQSAKVTEHVTKGSGDKSDKFHY